ncbi:MAG TPA: LPD7 domain-containing protein [Steroidobacteraceae bacterium]
MSDLGGAEDPARLPQGRRPARDDSGRNRASRPRARDEREGVNSIRPRRVRDRAVEKQRAGAPSGAKKEPDSRSDREGVAPAASAAKPPDTPASATGDLWALPQSVRDRFIQDKRRFYFPDGAPAFRDHGRRLSTGSENTEVISSLIEIARTRGWEEVRIAGTRKFRQEAWRQGRLAGLEVRGYKPTESERAAVVRALRRRGQGAQMELGVSENGLESNLGVREGAASGAASKSPNAGRARALILGKLIDHGRESYRFDPHESMSYFLEIGTVEGKRTIWGKDLERAMKQSLTQPQMGDEIGIRARGADQVTVKRRARDADGRIIKEREITTRRNHWIVEKREFFEARAAAAEVLRNPNIDRRQAVGQHPELVGTYLQLHAAQLTARRIRDPEDRERFIAIVRGALADSIARGDPLQPVRLRDRVTRVPERKPPEREPGPARA